LGQVTSEAPALTGFPRVKEPVSVGKLLGTSGKSGRQRQLALNPRCQLSPSSIMLW